MELFSALIPPVPVADHLARALSIRLLTSRPEKLGLVPSDTWHVTLGYYGDTDAPDTRARQLADRYRLLDAPTLHLGEAEVFSTSCLGMLARTIGPELQELHDAAPGNNMWPFRPHLTIARGSAYDINCKALLHDYTGPEWTATEVVLLGATAPLDYTVLARYPLRDRAKCTCYSTCRCCCRCEANPDNAADYAEPEGTP